MVVYLRAGGIASQHRVLRGGSWNKDASNCRVASRNNDNADNRNHNHNQGHRLSNTACVPDL